jgi:cystathionine gamma-synthase
MAASMSEEILRPETIAAHALEAYDKATGAVVPPLHAATTFARDAAYGLRLPSSYQRNGHPTLWQAEAIVAALEKGAEAQLFSSGMAALVALVETVPQGAHVVMPEIVYYGTRDWLKRQQARGRLRLTMFKANEAGSLARAIATGDTDLVWIETPANPTWDVIDIAGAARLAHAAGAILAVDSTAAGAVTTHPLTLGADIVFHSATKYLNGHSDVLAGILVTAEANARWAEVKALRTQLGSPLAPFESWLLIRGLRTLFVRFRQASANALAIARHFDAHSGLEAVLYPGLQGHPGHAIARRQMSDGFGGMMSLLVRGGLADTAAVLKRLRVFTPATSLGGVESLIEHRKLIESPGSPVPDNLLRLSIGIEAVEDLIADLEQALG